MIPVVILTAGGGKRMGEIAKFCNKALLPVGDGTLLSQHLKTFHDIGAREFIIIVDPSSDKIEIEAQNFLKDRKGSLKIIPQESQGGIGHAVLLAKKSLAGSPFILVLGDTYYIPKDIESAITEIKSGKTDAVLSVRRVSDKNDIFKECTIEIGDENRVLQIIEKPKEVLSMMKPCGIYFFGPDFMEILGFAKPSKLRGEIELTDAIDTFIQAGKKVVARETLKFDVNINYPQDILLANLIWLKEKKIKSFSHITSIIEEGVVLSESVIGKNSRIGKLSKLKRAVVFPGSEVPEGSNFENTIILPDMKITIKS